MLEIGKDELKVMNSLVHAETVGTVISETGLQDKVVIDIVRHLHHYRYIKAVDANGKEMPMFEIDKIKRILFMLTAKGFSEIEGKKLG